MELWTPERIKQSFIPDDLLRYTPPPKGLAVEDRDFIAWPEHGTGRYFSVIPTSEELVGLIFQMNPGQGTLTGRCSLCMATNYEVGTKAALIETLTNPRRKVGYHVCADLECSARCRGLVPGIFMYETIGTGRRIERLQFNLQRLTRAVRG